MSSTNFHHSTFDQWSDISPGPFVQVCLGVICWDIKLPGYDTWPFDYPDICLFWILLGLGLSVCLSILCGDPSRVLLNLTRHKVGHLNLNNKVKFTEFGLCGPFVWWNLVLGKWPGQSHSDKYHPGQMAILTSVLTGQLYTRTNVAGNASVHPFLIITTSQTRK